MNPEILWSAVVVAAAALVLLSIAILSRSDRLRRPVRTRTLLLPAVGDDVEILGSLGAAGGYVLHADLVCWAVPDDDDTTTPSSPGTRAKVTAVEIVAGSPVLRLAGARS